MASKRILKELKYLQIDPPTSYIAYFSQMIHFSSKCSLKELENLQKDHLVLQLWFVSDDSFLIGVLVDSILISVTSACFKL